MSDRIFPPTKIKTLSFSLISYINWHIQLMMGTVLIWIDTEPETLIDNFPRKYRRSQIRWNSKHGRIFLSDKIQFKNDYSQE